MREIKFRAWHTKLNRMIPAHELVADQMTLLADGRFINVHSGSTELSIIFPADKFIPLQFTGYIDRNGKEIYHNDIVELDGYLAEVAWGDCEWYLSPLDENHWIEDWNMADDGGRFKIIGNIHESPHLLEANVSSEATA